MKARLREWLREIWYHRPTITTHAREISRVCDAQISGFGRGLEAGRKEAAEYVGKVYDAGRRSANLERDAERRASRTTSTGRTLVSV